MKIAFICPIHDGKSDFLYGYRLYKSAQKYFSVDDLYYVFSDELQKDKFVKHIEKYYGSGTKYLIYPDDLDNCKCPVTIKKYYALQCLMEKYDYLAAIDCETVFIKKFSENIMEEIFDKKELVANVSGSGGALLRKSAELLGILDSEYLRDKTCNYTLYWWFNDIPVYKSATLCDFFLWIKTNKYYQIIFDNWCCFDYIIYGFWLILYCDFDIRMFNDLKEYGVVESLCDFGLKDYKQVFDIEKKYNTHWSSYVLNRRKRDKNNDIFLLFQFDRSINPTSFCFRLWKYIIKFLSKCKRIVLNDR